MGSSPSRLTPLQRDLLDAFFAREQRFFLTGGAALAGFYFGHRATNDLDLFASPGIDLEEAARTLGEAASACGAGLESVKKSPTFARFNATRGEERCIVDLVVDSTARADPAEYRLGSIRVDTPREIAANKLCAVLGRAEIRDLVDLMVLLRSGLELRGALADAERKDAGVDPATLAWVLDQIRIGPSARLPGQVTASELDAFRVQMVHELRRLALERAQKR